MLELRSATSDDVDEILHILIECAPLIPLVVDGRERVVLLRQVIVHALEWSVVADEDGHVVGFLLLQADELEAFLGRVAMHMRYGGVTTRRRRTGVMTALIKRAQHAHARLTAEVKAANAGGMARRLLHNGFTAADVDGTTFSWDAA